MKGKRAFFSVGLAALMVLLMAGGPAAADNGEPAALRGFGVDCVVLDPGTEETVDGIYSFRGLVVGGFVVSDNELLAGTSVVTINADINLKTGIWMNWWGSGTFYPYAVDGTWEFPIDGGSGPLAPAMSHGYGTGDLAGLRLNLRGGEPRADFPDELPCTEPMRVLEFKGAIVPASE